MVMRIALPTVTCLLMFTTSLLCYGQTKTGKIVTLQGIAKAVSNNNDSKMKHLEITVSNVTYRLESEMISQNDIPTMNGSLMTVSGTVVNPKDKIKVIEVITYDFEKSNSEMKIKTSDQPTNAPHSSPAAGSKR